MIPSLLLLLIMVSVCTAVSYVRDSVNSEEEDIFDYSTQRLNLIVTNETSDTVRELMPSMFEGVQYFYWPGAENNVLYKYNLAGGVVATPNMPANVQYDLGFDVIEIHDVDGNGVNDLLIVNLVNKVGGGPLTILYRDELSNIIDYSSFLYDQMCYVGYCANLLRGSLDNYSFNSTNNESSILFSFKTSSQSSAWIVSFSNTTNEIRYWVLGVEGEEYGTSIASWYDTVGNGFKTVVVGDPEFDSTLDGRLYVYYISDLPDGSTTHIITGSSDVISFNYDSSSGYGNSVSIIEVGSEPHPRIAVGTKYGNFFVTISTTDGNVHDAYWSYFEQASLCNSSGFGKSITPIVNGDSSSGILVGYDTGACLINFKSPALTTTEVFESTLSEQSTLTYLDQPSTTSEVIQSTEVFESTLLEQSTSEILSSQTTVTTVTTVTATTATTAPEDICIVVPGSCDEGDDVIIKPPTNTSTGIIIAVDVIINHNATITGSNVTITGTITITGSLDIDSSSLDIKNKVDIGGDLNVGNSVLIFSKNGGIKTDGCVNFASDSEIKIDITDEEKKELAKNGEGFVLIESDCFEGEEKFTNGDSACEQGVKESIKVEDDKMSVIFENCLEPGYIVLILLLIVAGITAFLLIVIFTPLRHIIFPHRKKETKRDTTVRDARVLRRLTLMDSELKDITNRTSTLADKLDSLSDYSSYE